jgi:transglutaminase-like putative cysteine protease
MKFNVSAELGYDVRSAGTLILNIHALRTPRQAVLEETFTVDPYFRVEELAPVNCENRFVRLETGDAQNLRVSYRATVDNAFVLIPKEELDSVPVGELPSDVISYLFPSRYCPSDKLYRFANNKFGGDGNAFERVLNLTDWIFENVEYLSGSTNSSTSAFDTVTELAGVCRDFAHLGIALCRALTIPARYFTGYAHMLKPPDFHACFEAYLGGHWVLFDATRLAPLNGIVKIATGRDAADAAVASIFGEVNCSFMNVSCDTLEEFNPFYYHPEATHGLSYF